MKTIALAAALLLSTTMSAQERSSKRGMGWDESSVQMTDAQLDMFAPGVAWVYNWGNMPRRSTENISPDGTMSYAPMCWNSNYNEAGMRTWLDTHSETRWLLGFNEPNFSAQANMTPQAAANAWSKVKQIAADYGLRLVAPALNFTGEKVGGRTWNPYEWLDEFLRLCPDAGFDCLALHCYMNWASANTWFATEYFYKDLYNSSKKDVYGKYPNLVKYLDDYKAEHGHFPRMMLTEFCSWENDGTISSVDFQIDQMTQKLQALEKSDLVEGYAWFMANSNAASYPYNSLLQTKSSSSKLSDLGQVYVHMSSFDTTKFYAPDETILAKDYVDASINDQQIKLRPCTDTDSSSPLQVQFIPSAWATYQVSIPADGTYKLTFSMNSPADHLFYIYVDKKVKSKPTLASTNNTWAEREIELELTVGNHNIMLYNPSTSTVLMSEWTITTDESGIAAVKSPHTASPVYNLSGQRMQDTTATSRKEILIVNGKKQTFN